MRKLVSHLLVTLDGVVQLDAVVDTIKRLRAGEVSADFSARIAQEDAMLLGRVTYQQWAGFWPTSTIQPFADHINTVTKYVASRTLDTAPWGPGASATVLSGELASAIAALKRQPGKNIGVHGSPRLVAALLNADLLDELRLELYPVVAGHGTRLFQDDGPIKHLQLTASTTTGNGVAILSYQPAQPGNDGQKG